jgi:hypothetical protein
METNPPSLSDLAPSLAPYLNGDSPQPLNDDSLSPRGGERDGDRGGGPQSAPGKSTSRLNSMRHGLDATDEIFMISLNPREQHAFRTIRRSLRTFYNCANSAYERMLIDKMAIQHLRMLRLYKLESETMNTMTGPKDKSSIIPHLDRFSRYDVRIERQLRILHNRLLSVFDQNACERFKPFSNME